ncbi:MAG: hypothetical protein KDB61_02160 [Planctomycetes bacterium]|nr:hypothetical protein [Planctomycetota bacterium]
MTGSRVLSLGVLAFWCAFFLSLQLVLVYRMQPTPGAQYPWMPDLTIALAVALAVRVPRPEILPAILVLALVRVAFSTDPPAVILAAFLAVSIFVAGLRQAIEVNGILPRTLIAFLCAAGMSVWGRWVLQARSREWVGSGWVASDTGELFRAALPGAVTTCLLVGLCGVALAQLPGLSPLYRRPKI